MRVWHCGVHLLIAAEIANSLESFKEGQLFSPTVIFIFGHLRLSRLSSNVFDFLRRSLTFFDFPRLSSTVYDCLRLCSTFYDFLQLSTTVFGVLRLPTTVHDFLNIIVVTLLIYYYLLLFTIIYYHLLCWLLWLVCIVGFLARQVQYPRCRHCRRRCCC